MFYIGIGGVSYARGRQQLCNSYAENIQYLHNYHFANSTLQFCDKMTKNGKLFAHIEVFSYLCRPKIVYYTYME